VDELLAKALDELGTLVNELGRVEHEQYKLKWIITVRVAKFERRERELVDGLKAAVQALECAEQHYIPTSSAARQVWGYCDGANGSPDIRKLVKNG